MLAYINLGNVKDYSSHFITNFRLLTVRDSYVTFSPFSLDIPFFIRTPPPPPYGRHNLAVFETAVSEYAVSIIRKRRNHK